MGAEVGRGTEFRQVQTLEVPLDLISKLVQDVSLSFGMLT